MKLFVIFTVAAVLAFSSSAVVNSSKDGYSIENSTIDPLISTYIPDFTDDEDDDNVIANDENLVIDGVPLKYLTKQEREAFLDEEDEEVIADLDRTQIINIVRTRISKGEPAINNKGVDDSKSGGRIKRQLSTLFRAAANLFRGSSRAGRTTSGSRVTQQYNRPGNYQDAQRDFQRLNPQNQKSFTTNKGISGTTGTVGNHRVTVRNGSSNGSPTLEIRSPKPDRTDVRKFRYNQK